MEDYTGFRFSFVLLLSFSLSLLLKVLIKLNPLKAGAAGLSFGVIGLCEEVGLVPITPTLGGGLAWPAVKNSSSSLAIPVDKAVVDPC